MPLEAFAAELRKRRLHHRLWLEIEGIGDAFGNFAADSTWWPDLPGFPARERFDRVLDLAAEVPNFSSQQLDHAGGRVSLGTCGVVVVERDGVLHQLFATRRPGPSLEVRQWLFGGSQVIATGSSAESWPESGVAYIGRETVTFTKTSTVGAGVVLDVERGAYRSRVIDHPVGTPITLHPTILSDRRVWLWWQLREASVMAFSGHLESVQWRDGGTALELQCADEQGNAKTPLFREAFAGEIASDEYLIGMPLYYDERKPEWTPGRLQMRKEGGNGWENRILEGQVRELLITGSNREGTIGQVIVVKGDGTYRGRVVLPPGSPEKWEEYEAVELLAGRSIVKTEDSVKWDKQSRHYYPRPCLLITPPKSDDAADGADWREHVIWKRGTHPLEVELQLLLSKKGDGANGYWDVLPPGYGYGIDEKRVDLDSFEALRERTPDLRVETVITAPVDDGREWRIKNLYQPFGFYPRLVFGGRYSVGFLGDPPDHFIENAHVITEDQIISWEGPGTRKRDVVDSFTFKADARISLEPPHELETRLAYKINGQAVEEVRFVDEVTDAGPADNATGRSVEVDCVTVHNWHGEQGSIIMSTPIPHATQVAQRLRGYIERRFRTPHSYLNLKLRIEDAPISVGDLVRVHARAIPNTASGTAGLNGELFEVVERTLNLSETTVDLVLAQSDATVEERVARSLGPAMLCTAIEDHGALSYAITVEANQYTQAPDVDSDAFHVDDEDPLNNNDRCIIVRADRSKWSQPFFLSGRISPTQVSVLKAQLGDWDFQPGDVIIYADRASCTPRQRRLYLFAAKPSLRFSDGDDVQGWA